MIVKPHVLATIRNIIKILPFWSGPVAVITLTDIKDVVAIVVGLLGGVCTVYVTFNTIRKNKEYEKAQEKEDALNK